MLDFLHKYRIAATNMQLDSLGPIMIYIDTNYATQCRYLYNLVHYVNIFYMLHAQMYDERKWIDMYGNKK
jgi:hypothetical protein